MNLENLSKRGFIHHPCSSNLRSHIEKGVTSWKEDFCRMLTISEKGEFIYTDDGNRDGTGYERKPGGGTTDFKETFHYTRNDHKKLMKAAEGIDLSTTTFIENSQNIMAYLNPLILEFAGDLEQKYNMSGLQEEVADNIDRCILRWIHYFADDTKKAGGTICAPHADKSGFTFHLFESHPGLQYLELRPQTEGARREWMPLPVSETEMAIITNLQMQYRSGGSTTALCHRVVATDTTASQGRYSAVMFVPLHRTPAFNKLAVGRAQDQIPDFNYDMTPGDFARYFERPN